MSENHGIRSSIKRTKDEILPLKDKTAKFRRVTTDDGGINQLPDDVIYNVFLILHWEDLMNAGLVSRRWERLCKRACPSLRVLDYNWDTMFNVPQAHCSSPFPQFEDPFFRRLDRSVNYHHGGGARRASLRVLDYNWETLFNVPHTHCSSRPFYCPDFKDRFFTCVDRSINNHCANAHISSFKFEFCLGNWSPASRALLDHWISCALSKGATGLDLKYMCSYECILKKIKISERTPCVLSNFEQAGNLKSLSLSWCILPKGTVTQMLCLKSLRLVSIELVGEVFNSFLYGCRNLESIHLEHCDLPLTVHIPDSLTQLKCLWVAARYSHYEMNFFISSPNLHTYSYRGPSIMLSLHEVVCLKNLCLEIVQPTEQCIQYLFGRVSEENHMLESLTLSFQSRQPLQVRNVPQRITRFNQLKNLEIYDFMYLRFNVQKIINILEACPRLEKFSMATISLKEDEDEDKDETRAHPASFYKHLKQVFIGEIAFTDSYVKLATHLLEHSIVLEKMILSLRIPDHRRDYPYMVQKTFSRKKTDMSRASYRKFQNKVLVHRKRSVVSFAS